MSIDKQPSCNDSFEAEAVRVDDALRAILVRTPVIAEHEKLPLRDGLHRVLSHDILSPLDVPAHNNSAMDGYALASRDLPAEGNKLFRLAGKAYAGAPFTGECGENECIRVMTGAVMPDRTDTVVIQEDTRVEDSYHVAIGPGHRKSQNVRFIGEDIRKGFAVLNQGHRIKPADLGVLASLGINECRVYRKPRVCFFSTGDELRSLGEPLNAGEIYDSNRYSLFGLLSECQVDLIDMGVVGDRPEALRETLLAASRCADVILTSGGVSVGEADYIRDILQDIGSMEFWKIAMKPGRPLTCGSIGNSMFFGLPGNPVAVMVTFYQFVLPALIHMSGTDYHAPAYLPARCLSDIRKNPGRREYQRAIARQDENGALQVELTGKQGSGILTSMSLANCFIVLPEERGSVAAGEQVDVQFFNQYFH